MPKYRPLQNPALQKTHNLLENPLLPRPLPSSQRRPLLPAVAPPLLPSLRRHGSRTPSAPPCGSVPRMPCNPSLQRGALAEGSRAAVYPCRIGSFPGSDYRHRRKRPPGGAPGSGTPGLQRSGRPVGRLHSLRSSASSLPPSGLRPSARGGARPAPSGASVPPLRPLLRPVRSCLAPSPPSLPSLRHSRPLGRRREESSAPPARPRARPPPTGRPVHPTPPPRPAYPSPRRPAPPLRSRGDLSLHGPRTAPEQANPGPGRTLPLAYRPFPLPPGTPPRLRRVRSSGSFLASVPPPLRRPPQAEPRQTDARPAPQKDGTLQAPRCRLRARRLKGCPRRRLRFRAPVVPPSACAAWTPPAGSLDPPRPPAAGSPYASRSRGKLAKASVSQQPTTGGNQTEGGGQEAVCKTVSSISLTNFCRERGRRLTISICRWSFGVGPGFAPPGSEASTRSLTGTPSARARGATWESGILLRRSRRNPRRLVHANLLGKLRLRQAAGLPQRGKPLSERLEIVGFAFVIGRISFHGTLASFSAKKALTGTVYALKT